MKSKAEIRQNVINLLKNFDIDEKKRQTGEILTDLTQSKIWQKSHKIALYMPMTMEFDLRKLFDSSVKNDKMKKKEILIPKTLSNHQMIFVKYDSADLERSDFGMLEPKNCQEEIPDLIVVPGLAWNEVGFRIGFGGGYYDRYLSHFSGATVSVAYDFQRIDFVNEAHDKAVQQVFTGRK
ncbi:5-formyltetrahydrofolate cyclo-ligase [Lactococcus nasutitermitis]|uniref:5-formyltetrahydrofolate cyclo-ligase n=1 Tax=Lactococcus nasutitermitis TaxID=1652957 RepID=A0ABV9JHP5_9LACT|nr:5-formyltetrahydrofolate cyclo-ligase [Lactococcus nasutitermitis]